MGYFVRSTIMHIRATQHFHYGLLLSTPKEKERNKTIYTGKLPTRKRRTRNIFGFSFNYYYYSMKGKLTKSYTNFFCFSYGLSNTQEESKKKKIN